MLRVSRCILILLLLIVAVPSLAQAVTRLAIATGGSGAGDCTVTACTPQRSIDQAVAGDTVSWANGTYNGSFTINTSGSIGSKITLQAANRHQAKIVGTGSNDCLVLGSSTNMTDWIVDGLDISNCHIGIRVGTYNSVTATRIEIRHVLVYDWQQYGIGVERSPSAWIHDSVICCSPAPNLAAIPSTGIALGDAGNTQSALIEKNIIYSITDSQWISNTGRYGYGILGFGNNDNTIVRGNVLMDANKALIRFTGNNSGGCAITQTQSGDNITWRDNIFAHSQGGVAIGEGQNGSFMLNNLLYNILFTMDAKGNTPGGNLYDHNTFIMGPQTMTAQLAEYDGCPPGETAADENSTVTNSLFYGAFTATAQDFMADYSGGASWVNTNYNLFWRPGAVNSWFPINGSPPPGANSIHATGSQPTFVNAAGGNYALQAGSPGKNAGSDSADMGVAYNALLTTNLANQVFNISETENATSGTSTNFTVSTANIYMLYAYIPDSGAYTGNETWSFDGASFNMNTIQTEFFNAGWGGAAPSRYVYLGSHKPSSTSLTVSWTTSNSTSKVRIRKLPTPAEAYLWLSAAAPSSPWVGAITTGSDDAEENISTGAIDLSGDLEMPEDTNNARPQLVGFRFANVQVPQGMTITSARIQFTGDTTEDPNTGSPNLVIKLQNSVNAPTFSSTTSDISSRSLLAGSVGWSPGTWTQSVANAGSLSPNVSSLVQTIISNGSWVAGNALAFVFSGNAGTRRSAASFDDGAPAVLTIEFSEITDTTAPAAPTNLRAVGQ